MRTSMKMFLVMGFLIAISLFLNQYYTSTSINLKLEVVQRPNAMNILYWSDSDPSFDFWIGTGTKLFENCFYKNCNVTYHRDALPVEEFDALIFHGKNSDRNKMPDKRNSRQVYIYGNLESPIYTKHIFNNFYNWTMTYRRDADIFHPYGVFEKEKTHYKPPSVQEIKKRAKKITWLVSHCNTSSERELLADEINKYILLDVYGECSELRCPRTKTDECYDMMEKNYKFYLSFENSICEDYVTEKLFYILKKDIVPIVYGGADYKRMAPPKSVINVLDFKSVRRLAAYIRHLDTHHEEYLEFFKWKEDYVVKTNGERALCDLCQKLNQPIQPKVYSDLEKWWHGEQLDKCLSNFIKFFL